MDENKKIPPVAVNTIEYIGPEPVPDCEEEWIVQFDYDLYSGGVEHFGKID